jgi:hypothetical protein
MTDEYRVLGPADQIFISLMDLPENHCIPPEIGWCILPDAGSAPDDLPEFGRVEVDFSRFR